jgi:hypothetical protein
MPTPAVLRLRKFRERRRNGQAIYKITLDEVAIEELLIAAQLLTPSARDDHAAVEAALGRFINLLLVDE